MPTYDYRCERCGDFELVHSMSDAARKECPKCSGKIERLISKTTGRGFYVDEIPGGIRSMADGRMYTSKSEYRRSLKALGYEEVGTDFKTWNPKRERDAKYEKQLEEDAERTMYELRENDCKYLSELDKERCKIIDRNLEHYCYDNRSLNEDGTPKE